MSKFDGLTDKELQGLKEDLLETFQHAKKNCLNWKDETCQRWGTVVATTGETLLRLDEHCQFRNKNKGPST